MAARSLLFDLDGTIWDSGPWYARLFARASRRAEPDVLARLASGRTVVALARECGLGRGEFARSCRELVAELRLYPDVRESLAALTARGTQLAIVTNLPSWVVTPMLEAEGLRDRFVYAVFAAGKPRPRGLSAALAALEESAEHAFYVGDSAADADAARDAGIRFAWASYGAPAGMSVAADVTLARFSDVLAL